MPVTQMISLDVQLRVSQLSMMRRTIDRDFMAYISEAKRRREHTSGMEAARMIALDRIDAWIQEELSR